LQDDDPRLERRDSDDAAHGTLQVHQVDIRR
jgi:hypothetical protein